MLTVVTPASNWQLTTLATLKAELGIDGDAEDVRLGQLIDRASSMIVGHCRRPFARQVVTERFQQPLGDVLVLSLMPAEVSGISVDGGSLAPEGWFADPDAAMVTRLDESSCSRSWTGRSTVVSYAAGYILPGDAGYEGALPHQRLPGDVEQACITAVTALRAGSKRDPMLRSESVDGIGSNSWIATADMAALPPQAVDLLQPYRLVLVG